MPSKNPRIALTVQPHRYELLKRLSEFQGTTMAGLISDTMEMMYPVMERVCVVLEAAKKAEQTSKEGFKESIAKAEAELLPIMYEAVSQFDMFVGEAAKAVGAPDDSATRAESAIREIMSRDQATGEEGPTMSRMRGVVGSTDSGNPRPVIRGSGIRNQRK